MPIDPRALPLTIEPLVSRPDALGRFTSAALIWDARGNSALLPVSRVSYTYSIAAASAMIRAQAWLAR